MHSGWKREKHLWNVVLTVALGQSDKDLSWVPYYCAGREKIVQKRV